MENRKKRTRGIPINAVTVPVAITLAVLHVLIISLIMAINTTSGSLSTIIGVVCGIIIMGDIWGWYTVIGLGITLIGVWLSTMRMRDDLN